MKRAIDTSRLTKTSFGVDGPDPSILEMTSEAAEIATKMLTTTRKALLTGRADQKPAGSTGRPAGAVLSI
ncbi:hypothetical protein [Citricoccus sp. SGAir0253]|uniref:hypothetical protein n=1 Tax=Citricoccus sp. SGAir0253 TaxID=2567881 RepID=UPI00143DEECD|nr:hypothetical protein [Citricoccus sp. SGAir0253]